MKGLVKVNFTDKTTNIGYLAGRTVEFADLRMKELADKGFIEIRDAEAKPVKTEPVKVEEKAEKLPKKAPAKSTKKK